LVNSVMETG